MSIKRPRVDRKANLSVAAGRIIDLHPDWAFVIDGPYGQLSIDLNPYRSHDRDEIAGHMRDALWSLRHDVVGVTIRNYLIGLRTFWRFLEDRREDGESITHLNQVDRQLLDRFLSWLESRLVTSGANRGQPWSVNAKRRVFSSLMSLLINRQKNAPASVSRNLSFPRNPFPNSNRHAQRREPYSVTEQKRILEALNRDLKIVHEGHGNALNSVQVLTVHLLILALATGRNLQPLLDLRRDALRSHPLADRELLVTNKRRGWATHATSVRRYATTPLGQNSLHVIPSSIGDHFRFLSSFTASLAEEAAPIDRDYVFLLRGTRHKRNGKVVRLDPQSCPTHVQSFAERHSLLDDRGQPLSLQVARLRPTFANELYRCTRDIRRVQQALGHADINTTARHYLSAPINSERDHAIVLDAMVSKFSQINVNGKTLLAADGKLPTSTVTKLLSGGYNTGIARCKNPFRENESICKKFFSCFSCPNMCVFEDDLWRLFSFYYRILSEQPKINAAQWLKTYGRIIRRIDEDISSRFPADTVAAARLKARTNPHPAWRVPLV